MFRSMFFAFVALFGTNVLADAIETRSFTNLELITNFGDGSDGDVSCTSSSTISRDMFYNNLTIGVGCSLRTAASSTTAGVRIYVRNLMDLTACPTLGIFHAGVAGGNAAATAAGAAGTGILSTGTLTGSNVAGAGANGGTSTGAQGGAATGVSRALGGVGGASGAGGLGFLGAGGAGRALVSPTGIQHVLRVPLVDSASPQYNGGNSASGGGSGGGDGTAGGGSGGGGGAGGNGANATGTGVGGDGGQGGSKGGIQVFNLLSGTVTVLDAGVAGGTVGGPGVLTVGGTGGPGETGRLSL